MIHVMTGAALIGDRKHGTVAPGFRSYGRTFDALILIRTFFFSIPLARFRKMIGMTA